VTDEVAAKLVCDTPHAREHDLEAVACSGIGGHHDRRSIGLSLELGLVALRSQRLSDPFGSVAINEVDGERQHTATV